MNEKVPPPQDPRRSKTGIGVEATGSVREAPDEKCKNSVKLGHRS